MSPSEEARPRAEDGHPGQPASAHDTASDLPLPPAELLAWVDGYMTGHERGRVAGMAEYDEQLVDGLTRMLGGDTAKDYGDAVRAHEASLRAKARRAAADRGELAA